MNNDVYFKNKTRKKITFPLPTPPLQQKNLFKNIIESNSVYTINTFRPLISKK